MIDPLPKDSLPRDPMLDEFVPLVEDMRRGDERALESLYEATVGRLYAVAHAILRHDADSDAVVCATYAQAWQRAANYDGARGNVLAWLLTMCRGRAIDLLRKRRARLDSPEATAVAHTVDDGLPQDLLSLVQQDSRVHAALSALPVESRKLVSLAFLHGLSYREIATWTGLPIRRVKSDLREALLRLRSHLEIPT